MGCASSAALPFLKGGGGENGVVRGVDGVRTMVRSTEGISKATVTNKITDSGFVQDTIGSVVNAKDNILHQVQGAGHAATQKVNMVVQDIEEHIDSAMCKVKGGVSDLEDSLMGGVKGAEDSIKTGVEGFEKELDNMEEATKEKVDLMGDKVEDLEDVVKEGAEKAKQAAMDEIEKEGDLKEDIDDLLATLTDEKGDTGGK